MKRNSEQQNEIVKEALERFETASDGWSDIYEQSVADVSFIDDDEGQWEDSVRESRHNRPCLTFDKLSASVDRVVGGQMAQMPSVKVRAAEEGDERHRLLGPRARLRDDERDDAPGGGELHGEEDGEHKVQRVGGPLPARRLEAAPRGEHAQEEQAHRQNM